jgi:hypothetical protein
MYFKDIMQLARKPDESMATVHFKIPKVNSAAVMQVLM